MGKKEETNITWMDVLMIAVLFKCEWVLPNGQFLLSLASLQDVNEVFQVVEVLGPGQPATHGSDHLH